MDWGKEIKELRLKMCLTQTEMAEFIGVAFISVNRYENHKTEPTMKVKRKIKELIKKQDMMEDKK